MNEDKSLIEIAMEDQWEKILEMEELTPKEKSKKELEVRKYMSLTRELRERLDFINPYYATACNYFLKHYTNSNDFLDHIKECEGDY